jgi:hypothetical protein
MTAYIKLSTNEYPRHIGDIEIDDIGMEDFAVVQWVDSPQYDTKIQTCYEGVPVQIDSIWCMTWVVRDLTQEEIDLANRPIDERFPI